ncbi:hypothetical protein MRX96_056679 [Rhipicephalus microplus]
MTSTYVVENVPEMAVTTIIPGPETETPTRPTTAATTQPVPAPETISTEPSTLPTEVITPEPVATETPAPPKPRPALVCQHGEFSCRDDSTCIPSALLCDGVKDCPNGLDEKCGSAWQCKEDEFYCPSRSPSACMPRSLLCDGHEDCAGGSDESLCRACPDYFCRNDGTCGWTPKAPSPTCECRDGYRGRRCNLLTSTVPRADTVTSKGSAPSAGIVAAIVVVLMILIVATVASIAVIRKRRNLQNAPVFLDNPSYDAAADETKLFN